MDGTPARMGFYTTRFVEAPDPAQAEYAAVDVLRKERKLESLNERDDPPRVFVDEVEEVSAADVPAVVQGFVFFPDERAVDA
jgi:hypothetical protein